MTSLPNVPAKAVGDFGLAADWNAYVDNLAAWLDTGRPIIHAYQTATQTISTATFTPITFTAETVDRRGQHSTASNTSRITATADLGTYFVVGVVAWATNATGTRRAKLVDTTSGVSTDLPGSQLVFAPGSALGSSITFGIWIPSASTSYVEMHGYQDSGGNLATTVSGAFQSQLIAWRLGS